jgi:outer membrane protein insertion porin family
MILDLQKTDVELRPTSSDEIREFLSENGEDFLNFSVTGTHIHDSRNRRMFGTQGLYHRSRIEITTPLSDLEYYKLEHKHKWLYPINDIFTFSTRSTIAYGDTYGGESDLPFFEKFRAGGSTTVRGYTMNTLGPRDSRNDAYGGNFLTTAGVQVYFPVPSLMDPTRFRLGVFADAGNVFEDVDEFETSELRGSVGLEVNMFTGMGGITFSFSAPVNDDEEDETESFQFEFGTSF